MSRNTKTSDLLEDFVTKGNEDIISLFDIRDALHHRGFAILMLLIALPLSIPLPVPPGFTTVWSLPILLFSFQMLYGRQYPWLPNWIGKKTFKRKSLASIIEKSARFLRKMESITKQRLNIFTNTFGEKIYSFMSLILSISIAIPLPLTNFVPALGIVLMSIGMINKDGVIFISGILVGIVGLFISSIVIIFGPKLIMDAWNALF